MDPVISPTSDFLAREALVLGEDASMFDPLPLVALSSSAQIQQAPISAPTIVKKSETSESSHISSWKLEFQEQIKQRDSITADKHAKIIAKQRADLEKFNAEYMAKKERGIAANREAEKRGSGAGDLLTGNVWVIFYSYLFECRRLECILMAVCNHFFVESSRPFQV